MANDIAFAIAGLIGAVILLAAGFGAGYHVKSIYQQLQALRARQDEAEKDAEPANAVIAAKTPTEYRRQGEQEDSAIVIAKTPKVLQREKDLKLMRDIERDNA